MLPVAAAATDASKPAKKKKKKRSEDAASAAQLPDAAGSANIPAEDIATKDVDTALAKPVAHGPVESRAVERGAKEIDRRSTGAAARSRPTKSAAKQAAPRTPSADRTAKTAAPAGPRVIPSNHVTGIFRRRRPASASFARPGPRHGADRKLDIFIPADRTLDAASGDTVLVRLQKHSATFAGPIRTGEIVEVLERDTHQFVGTYFESAGSAFVQVDGTVFSRPVLLGDPGAKNAQPDDKVVFEMVRFPSHVHDGEGVITEVLGGRGEPGVDTLSIVREFNLPEHFRRRRAGRSSATGRTVRRNDPRAARRFDRRNRDHDRSGRRPRFRRRDLARAAAERALAAGRAYCRRVALRPAAFAAGSRGAEPRARAFICPTA